MVLYLLPERLVSKPYIQEPEHREKSLREISFSLKKIDVLRNTREAMRSLHLHRGSLRGQYITNCTKFWLCQFFYRIHIHWILITCFDIGFERVNNCIRTKPCFRSLACLSAIIFIVTTSEEWNLGYTKTINLRLILLTTIGNEAVLPDLPLQNF